MTTKLIDGTALADRLFSNAITDDQRRMANLIRLVIEEMPEAVVRCGECEHFRKYTDTSTWCERPKKQGVHVEAVCADHYCGYGVRKK